MNRIFTKKFRNIVLILIGLFIVLFCFRLGYGYTLKVEEVQQEEVNFDYFESSKNNYAFDRLDVYLRHTKYRFLHRLKYEAQHKSKLKV